MSELNATRREFMEGTGALIVGFSIGGARSASAQTDGILRGINPAELDSWIAIASDGSVTVYSGRVDLGTGTEIVLAQFAAEELDVPVERVRVIMGDTRVTPDQGKTTASLNVIRGTQPIRIAAAEARAALLRMASEKLGVAEAQLQVEDGIVRPAGSPGAEMSYGELIGNKTFSITLELAGTTEEDISRGIMLKENAPLKSPADYRVIGQSIPRPDIPDKVSGTYTYVHNVRVPGMLHGRVVRPPAIGATLLSVSDDAFRGIAGAQMVRRSNFLGVVAPREEDAVRAARALNPEWSNEELLPEFDRIYDELPNRPVVSEVMSFDDGDIETGLSIGTTRIRADYNFPFQKHAMIGPSCAIADVKPDRATIWSGSQWPQGDRSDIAAMLGMAEDDVQLIWHAASGSYGRLACDDAAADAAIMSQAVGRPVRVQWMRDDEHGWEPVSPAMTMSIEGACDENGRITAFDYLQYSPSHSTGEKGNHLAWHLIGGAPGWGRLSGGGAALWYDIAAKRGRNVYVEPWLRGIYLRSPGGFQSTFAYESFIDELSFQAGFDPLEFRLLNVGDPRERDVLEAVAEMSDWRSAPATNSDRNATVLNGRGIAMGRYGREGGSISALVVDVVIERASGQVKVERVFIAFDCGHVINPDGLVNQIEGGLLQGLSRGLHEELRFDRKKVTGLDWNAYPILTFDEVPEVETRLISRPDLPWASAGEAGQVATAAALANAVSNATGGRVRRLPLKPDYVKSLI
jgi:nicotinate dehydrogenase subunit B